MARVLRTGGLDATLRIVPGEPLLRRGATGGDVLRLQHALRVAGGQVSADGDFGPRTEAAVKAFQLGAGLVADGVVGPRTWAALRARPVRRPQSAELSLSEAGARFIAGFEGFRARLYDDAAGHCTIGYGHLVHHGPCDGSEPTEFRAGISRDRALELLRADAERAAEAVRANVRVPLGQEQFDALVSFVFNVGAGAFAGSTLLRELNAGDYGGAPAQLARWVKAGGRTLPGLVRRREAEGRLFAEGVY